jgi:hypothetical protein
MEEAAVAAARAVAAPLRLQHDDLCRRPQPLQLERRPKPRIAAADDRDIGRDRSFERRRRLVRRRLLTPPRNG